MTNYIDTSIMPIVQQNLSAQMVNAIADHQTTLALQTAGTYAVIGFIVGVLVTIFIPIVVEKCRQMHLEREGTNEE